MEDQIGIPRRRPRPNGSDLLLPGIDRDVVLPLVLRLQQANHPIMLELLAHRPHEDGAHRTSESRGIAGDWESRPVSGQSRRKYSTMAPCQRPAHALVSGFFWFMTTRPSGTRVRAPCGWTATKCGR